jgi:hypothetical protein
MSSWLVAVLPAGWSAVIGQELCITASFDIELQRNDGTTMHPVGITVGEDPGETAAAARLLYGLEADTVDIITRHLVFSLQACSQRRHGSEPNHSPDMSAFAATVVCAEAPCVAPGADEVTASTTATVLAADYPTALVDGASGDDAPPVATIRVVVDDMDHFLTASAANASGTAAAFCKAMHLQQGCAHAVDAQLWAALSSGGEEARTQAGTAPTDSQVLGIGLERGGGGQTTVEALTAADIAVGVCTFGGAHATRVAFARQTWAHPSIWGADGAAGAAVLFFSDRDEDEADRQRGDHNENQGTTNEDQGAVVSCPKCGASANYLACKTGCMYRTLWRRFPDRKWFVRVMDDTLVMLPNLLDHLALYASHRPRVVGDWFFNDLQQSLHGTGGVPPAACDGVPYPLSAEDYTRHHYCLAYPGGGAGWAVSNGAMRLMMPEMAVYDDLSEMHEYENTEKGIGVTADDLQFGMWMAVIGIAPTFAADTDTALEQTGYMGTAADTDTASGGTASLGWRRNGRPPPLALVVHAADVEAVALNVLNGLVANAAAYGAAAVGVAADAAASAAIRVGASTATAAAAAWAAADGAAADVMAAALDSRVGPGEEKTELSAAASHAAATAATAAAATVAAAAAAAGARAPEACRVAAQQAAQFTPARPRDFYHPRMMPSCFTQSPVDLFNLNSSRGGSTAACEPADFAEWPARCDEADVAAAAILAASSDPLFSHVPLGPPAGSCRPPLHRPCAVHMGDGRHPARTRGLRDRLSQRSPGDDEAAAAAAAISQAAAPSSGGTAAGEWEYEARRTADELLRDPQSVVLHYRGFPEMTWGVCRTEAAIHGG